MWTCNNCKTTNWDSDSVCRECGVASPPGEERVFDETASNDKISKTKRPLQCHSCGVTFYGHSMYDVVHEGVKCIDCGKLIEIAISLDTDAIKLWLKSQLNRINHIPMEIPEESKERSIREAIRDIAIALIVTPYALSFIIFNSILILFVGPEHNAYWWDYLKQHWVVALGINQMQGSLAQQAFRLMKNKDNNGDKNAVRMLIEGLVEDSSKVNDSNYGVELIARVYTYYSSIKSSKEIPTELLFTLRDVLFVLLMTRDGVLSRNQLTLPDKFDRDKMIELVNDEKSLIEIAHSYAQMNPYKYRSHPWLENYANFFKEKAPAFASALGTLNVGKK